MKTKINYILPEEIDLESEFSIIRKSEKMVSKIDDTLLGNFDRIEYHLSGDNTVFYSIRVWMNINGKFELVTFEYDTKYESICLTHESWEMVRTNIPSFYSHPISMTVNYWNNAQYKTLESALQVIYFLTCLNSGWNSK